MKDLLILWDWDNTLMDTSEAMFKSLTDTMNHYGFPAPTQQDLNEVLGHHKGTYWENLFGDRLDEAFDYAITRFSVYHKDATLFPQSIDTLKFVYDLEYPQIIVSNKPLDLLEKEVSVSGVGSLVKGIVGTDYILPDKKPMPHFGQETISQVPHTRLMMIGDGAADMEYAKAIGATSVYIKSENMVEDGIHPDYRFDNLSQVSDWLHEYLTQQ